MEDWNGREKEEMMEEVLEDLEKDAAEKQAEEVSEAEETETETEAAESGEQAEETEESEAEDGQEAPADEKKGFFKKKKDKKDEQIEELNDKLKRQMAEFDNFRKRTEKEKTQMYDMGAKSIIEKILPVIDNFERGLAAVPEEQREDAFVVGMDKVYRQMLTELDASGVKPIEAVGQEFDPNFHNAVMQVESEEYDSGVVAQELQKGYMYKDSVVRHSMVAVVS
ncbi:MAG: nucleotide exchange factor GrpE [Roseburia sp.]